MRMRADFILKHAKERQSIIEFGCGTGDLLHYLSTQFETVEGVDMASDMLEVCIEKYPELAPYVTCSAMDGYQPERHFDVAVAVGDTLNYALTKSALEGSLGAMMDASDVLIFDYHHPFRLEEFSEPYFEEGEIDGFQYGYEIASDGDRIIHMINLMDGQFDIVNQRIFPIQDIIDFLEQHHFNVKVFTDFDVEGVLDEGEKVWFVCEKKR